MEGSATNEVKQGKKKNKERESPCEKEKEIPIPFDAEREKEILSDLLLRDGNTEMENVEVRQQERKSKDKEKETPPGFLGERTTKTEAHANVEVIRESETKGEEREIEALPNVETEKNSPLDFIRERETEMEALADNEVRGSKKKGEERENHCERKKDIRPSEREKEKKTSPGAEMENDAPPNDDICPICFENYNIPCKTNCGHWYCANCIITFWLYKSLFLRCKCPLCNQPIKIMTPDPSLSLRTENEVVEALFIIQAYNRLSGGGVHSLILKMRLLSRLAPMYLKRLLPYLLPAILVVLIVIGVIMFLMLKRYSRGLLDPDKLILNFAIARIVALALSLSYNYYGFGFLPGGFWGVSTIFECCTVGLVLVLAAVGLFRRITNNRLQPHRRSRRVLPPVVEPLPPVPGP
ncbi:uncharacterized protein LOC131332195 [Rhododendron vialii]|uniref:uncharacterized protein LOC131332195 n=1 Tax=Rhododendron vialii TaxID=182163 RepID=UPI00265D85FA|nr:uncharacterized protein LOC131332195 [Rhododendron vialii]